MLSAGLSSFHAGISVHLIIDDYAGSSVETLFAGISYFLAFGMLAYMAVWINKNPTLQEELHLKVNSAIEKESRFAITGFVFLAVFREDLEMVVFLLPFTFITNPVLLALQGVLGVILGVVFGCLIYVCGKNELKTLL
ncbi:hypothetical protein BTO28_02385 [Domibacillus epiphyticus]|uniref:Uncharacterized protein n=1 Tax=Domibacillus epiphyticus TaxID=1714355 RepID=A0A1V2ABG0_9BACI|nr:FTR1 family protein [Domibacillus epiphyticus]OMP68335.1 hypothetical protein BTO28_02385 [Domibacillus epiphyticus]